MADATAVVAGRQFWVWYKSYAAGNAMPADTILYGDVIPGYTKLGYTSGGLGMNWNLQRGTINVDQELEPVARTVQSRELQFDSNLAEFTPQNVILATGQGTLSQVPPSTGVRGHDEALVTSDVVDNYLTVLFDIRQQNGEALRLAAWRAIASGSPNPRIVPDQPAILAYQVSALPDSSTSPARIASVRRVLAPLP